MQMNKVMKSFIIALPVVTMMACSSGPSEEELAAER
ncbi:MAG TPA: peptidoglycan-associated lipoprotein, partial [Alteromonas macleodii]|nr:peptidoglycan-associated lipoprotein [Alteromonas macleodii]